MGKPQPVDKSRRQPVTRAKQVPSEFREPSRLRSARDKERSYTMKGLRRIGAPMVSWFIGA